MVDSPRTRDTSRRSFTAASSRRPREEAYDRAREVHRRVELDPRSWGALVAEWSDDPGPREAEGSVGAVEPGAFDARFEVPHPHKPQSFWQPRFDRVRQDDRDDVVSRSQGRELGRRARILANQKIGNDHDERRPFERVEQVNNGRNQQRRAGRHLHRI